MSDCHVVIHNDSVNRFGIQSEIIIQMPNIEKIYQSCIIDRYSLTGQSHADQTGTVFFRSKFSYPER